VQKLPLLLPNSPLNTMLSQGTWRLPNVLTRLLQLATYQALYSTNCKKLEKNPKNGRAQVHEILMS
jgi:hypothetical protein